MFVLIINCSLWEVFKLEYNRDLTAERLWDLRKDRSLSLAKLSKGIEEKTGVYISATQLQKYEDTDRPDIMNVKNLVAIADFYEVSYDYLLGYSEDKEREYHSATEQTGLSEKAVKKLASWHESVEEKQADGVRVTRSINTNAPEEISRLIESKHLSELIAYIRALGYISGKSSKFKNIILGPNRVKELERYFGENAARTFVMSEFVEKTFRKIVDEIVPFTPVEDEVRQATQADMDDF